MVYVDNLKLPYRGMLMSHMVADTPEELHGMADRLGLNRKWFQNGRVPHYDISQSKKLMALNFGAKEITAQELVKMKVKRL